MSGEYDKAINNRNSGITIKNKSKYFVCNNFAFINLKNKTDMRKKIIYFLECAIGLFAVCTTIFLSLNNSAKESNVTLQDLIGITDADAECQSSAHNNGTCGISDTCFWGRGTDYNYDTTLG